jgi:5-formyltetrahydrofolate cyclo-ligase
MSAREKGLIRKKMIERRISLSPSTVLEKSQSIVERLFQLPQYNNAKILLFYLPYKNEIDTISAIKKSWLNSKNILVPVCQPERKLLLSKLLNLDELAVSKFGLYEPRIEHQRPMPPQEVDLAILPGVAFDFHGYRLGYGGGYFDRFLDSLRPDCPKIALAYDFQILNQLPVEEHDTKVDIILTESKSYYVN